MSHPTSEPGDLPDPPAHDELPQPDAVQPDAVQSDATEAPVDRQAGPTAADVASQYAARSGVRRGASGQIDVLASIGGAQGLSESIAPGLVFTVLFTITRDLTVSLVAALAVSGVFALLRLVSRTPLTQAIAGLVGVAFCAFVAQRTGNATDFFLPGFFINGAYIIAMSASVILRWPFAGLLFGFIRNEGIEWRKDPVRVRAYSIATWIIVSVLALRLVVQVPLYLADNVAALGSSRVAMGLPLYALGIWLAWLVSRGRPIPGSADGSSEADGIRPR
ncbi:DUF3159 domain-containing protein [Arthrobacter echini]|uniref:DUF3159 domain-containing protein n=1 Tax=Arthrobacter echini TaxID=1529066 RepID=A0A4V3Z5U3_9MICC|nr:DUF3159 domain-containing protein [Arthrobacter echini]THJ67499.1 DUF3159 domain-containing protein [Arthrobacter echini]